MWSFLECFKLLLLASMWFPNTCTNAQLYALHYFREGTGVVVEGRPAVVAFRVEPDDVAEDGGIVMG